MWLITLKFNTDEWGHHLTMMSHVSSRLHPNPEHSGVGEEKHFLKIGPLISIQLII